MQDTVRPIESIDGKRGNVGEHFQKDIHAVQRILAVPSILDVVCRATGMGFAAVARVTEDRWIACQVLDNVDFGLPAGGELKVETTLCHEIRQHHEVIAIDNVAEDKIYRKHHTPEIYGLQSYISVPIILPDGRFFGTLCAIHSKTARVNNPETIGMFKLFAELIAYHLDASDSLAEVQSDLVDERKNSELREQFIAVLGHDLRNPLAGVDGGINRLLRDGWTERSPHLLRMMKASIVRMAGLVDNVMDLARARLGGGISLHFEANGTIQGTLEQVIEEFRTAHPDRSIKITLDLQGNPRVDHARLGQMFSNLLGNALTHGSLSDPVEIHVTSGDRGFELAVENKGAPIPQENLARLFRPFERAGGPHGQGLGLGLYISSEIAHAHGGTLEVASNEQATRFTFKMPLGL